VIDTIADKLMEEIKTLLASIENPPGVPDHTEPPSDKMFQSVVEAGQVFNKTKMPTCIAAFAPETADRVTNCHEEDRVELEVEVLIQMPVSPHPQAGNAGKWHRSVLGEMKLAFANTTLGGFAKYVEYAGGGLELIPQDTNNPPASFGFIAKWRIHFRHQIEDPTSK